MAKRLSNDGKSFENLVRMIQEAYKDSSNTEILSDVKLNDKTGGKGQIDILIIIQVSGYKITIAIECKDYNKPVSKEKIDAFYSKCDMIEEIDKAVFVSKSGYQSGAINAAKYRGIELYNIEDVTIDLINKWKDLGDFFQISLEELKNITYIVLFDNGNKWPGSSIPFDTVTISEGGLSSFKDFINQCVKGIFNDYALPAVSSILLEDFGFYITNSLDTFEKKCSFESNFTNEFRLGYVNSGQRFHTPVISKIIFEMYVSFKIHRPIQMIGKQYKGVVRAVNEADILQIKMNVYDLNLVRTEKTAEPKYFKVDREGNAEELKILHDVIVKNK